MDTIRNYLEAMFRSMPNTPEVRRAKDELWQMMEDKYLELIGEGVSENEAIGRVISDFGNLDELSETLGITRYLPARIENEARAGHALLFEEARDYLASDRYSVLVMAFGIFFCIVSPCGPILGSGLVDTFHLSLFEGLGVGVMFVAVAAGVGLILHAVHLEKQWAYIRKEPCSIDFRTAAFLTELLEAEEPKLAMLRGVGIVLCILSIVPVAVLSQVPLLEDLMEAIGAMFLFALAGLGAILILVSAQYDRAAKRMLKLNAADTIGGSYGSETGSVDVGYGREADMAGGTYGREVDMAGGTYERAAGTVDGGYGRVVEAGPRGTRAEAVLSVYWQTVICLYLSVSFLSFAWGATWVIWPIAWLIERVIRMNAGLGKS